VALSCNPSYWEAKQWDGLRWKISTSAADGIWWLHYDHPLAGMVLDKLLYHMRKQAWYKPDETPSSKG
jgi:hypothetical protein